MRYRSYHVVAAPGNAEDAEDRSSPWAGIAGRLGLLGLFAGLASLCIPAGEYSWLSVVCMVPLALALRGVSPRSGLFWGWLFGAVLWFTATWWLHYGLEGMKHMEPHWAWLATVVFCLYQGLPYALLGILKGWLARRGYRCGPLLCSAGLTLAIALRPPLCPTSLHVALARYPVFLQLAEMGGQYIVLFLLLYVNWLMAEAVADWRNPSRGWSRSLARIAGCAVLVASVWAYGHARMAHFRTLALSDAGRTVSVLAVQPYMDRSKAETPDPPPEIFLPHLRLGRLTREALEAGREQGRSVPDLVLWPEVPRQFGCEEDMVRRKDWRGEGGETDGPVRPGPPPILLACTEMTMDGDPVVTERVHEDGSRSTTRVWQIAARYNAAWAVRPDGKAVGVYRKSRLVPFAERMPFSDLLDRWGLRQGGAKDYSPGTEVGLLELPSASSPAVADSPGILVQPLLCYESGFTDLVREGVERGAGLLAVLTNDFWFQSDAAAALHRDMGLYRAVEFRRPMVSATNSGLGGHIRATGEIVPGSEPETWAQATALATLHCPSLTTLYARFGNLWLLLPGLWCCLRLVRALVFPRR